MMKIINITRFDKVIFLSEVRYKACLDIFNGCIMITLFKKLRYCLSRLAGFNKLS